MKKIFVILALGLASTQAHAFIQFEPFAGYFMGTNVQTDLLDAQVKSDLSGGYGGLRLAWMTPVRLWIGVEGETSFSSKGKYKESNANPSSYDFTSTTGYVSIGYETLARVRLYGGYGVYDSLVLKEDVQTATGDTTFSGGTAFKVGLGYHLTQYIAINVEYAMHDYKKLKNNAFKDVEIKEAGVKSEKASTYGVNFSLPFFW